MKNQKCKSYNFYNFYFALCRSLEMLEAATGDVLQQGVSLQILQNSQKNTCTRISFLIKLLASRFYRTHLGDCLMS